VARTAQPALLRGLIFTETGAAMTPHHTKRKGKRYCYYTSMDVIRKRPAAELRGPQRLPGAMVEDAVIGEIRRMLCTPEVAARTARAVRKDRPDLDETTVVAALAQFDDLWKALIPAEQARIVQLLVARITESEADLAIDLRHDGLGAIAADGPAEEGGRLMPEPETLRVHIPLELRRRDGRPRILPPKHVEAAMNRGQDPHLLRAIGRAWGWRQRLERGYAVTLADLAAEVGLSDRYVSRLLRLAWLAPDVLKRLVVHREPSTISIYDLCFVASLQLEDQPARVFD
jgi:hypothetical protein